ncbi:hypothetical protein [Gemmata sp.]|uniref:hypothetical protein n=1 Tax=Gemmata sp. TaxID=1914242 RepID=UPI003F730039
MLLALAAAALAAGCKGEEPLPPVAGTVTVDGRPVPRGTVTFYPDASKGNASPHLPTGILEPDGRFEICLPEDKKGAPPGWYRVVVFAANDPQPGKPVKFFVNKKYTDRGSTPLSVEVVANPEPGRYELKLEK